nr:hypothetical protein [Kibdelosporangium sp. MJ126-NF4]CEL13527.1 hypothetical protein [Kibdelosporangium sp. MJ126-NF4]CTQ99211.1 hypothetical protein [Kibdelosporangium sp. MJ126-NF4]
MISLSAVEVMAGLGVLLVLFMVWRVGSRRAKAAAEAARSGARFMSLAGRVLFTAGLIVGTQWLVITQAGIGWLLLAVLGVPALFASYSLTRALTVTTRDMPRGRR